MLVVGPAAPAVVVVVVAVVISFSITSEDIFTVSRLFLFVRHLHSEIKADGSAVVPKEDDDFGPGDDSILKQFEQNSALHFNSVNNLLFKLEQIFLDKQF